MCHISIVLLYLINDYQILPTPNFRTIVSIYTHAKDDLK